MSSDLKDKADILDRIRDGKKVKITWLATVSTVTIEEILEIAEEFKLLVEDEYIYAPEEESLLGKLNDFIEQVESEELKEYLRQPTYLEQELPFDSIEKIEQIFNSEGIKFKRKTKGKRHPDILEISKAGILVTNDTITLCNLFWEDMKNIRLTSITEKEFEAKRDYAKGALITIGNLLSRYHTTQILRSDRNHTFYPEQQQIPLKVQSVVKTNNSVLFSFHNREDVLINTIGFVSIKKTEFPKEYDSLIYILEHFFHKFKRKQMDL